MISSEMMSIVGPAFVAGLMITLTHAPLGIEVLRRGIIFIDLTVAQIAGLGLVAAGTLLHEPSTWLMQGIALATAILAGLFFPKVETAMPQQQEAIIGVSFVLAASLAILLLVDHPYGGEEIQHLLSGQMLFVTWADVASHAQIYVLILATWFLNPALRSGISFYLLFALAITSSVQLVGVYVVFASLILPALAAITANRPYRCMAMWHSFSSGRNCVCYAFRHSRRTNDRGELCLSCDQFYNWKKVNLLNSARNQAQVARELRLNENSLDTGSGQYRGGVLGLGMICCRKETVGITQWLRVVP